MNKLICLLLFLLSFTACHARNIIETKKSEIPRFWVMEDTDKMTKFLNTKEKEDGFYGLELNIKDGKAKIRFLYSKNEYTVNVKKLSEKMYQLVNKDKSRGFEIEKDSDSFAKRNIFYWYFKDSKPKDNRGSRDGDNIDCKNLDECIKQLESDYEFAQNEKAPMEPGDEPLNKNKEQKGKK
jgi:hypothetical protein